MTLARRRFPRSWAGCRSSRTRRCAPGSVRVVLASDYTGPGSGLDGTDPTLATADPAAAESTDSTDAAPPPSPIITAGSDDPECVN